MSEQEACDPTEKTLYAEPHDDHWGTWQDKLFICGEGPYKGIGISNGCEVFVRPLKEWHRIGAKAALADEMADYIQAWATFSNGEPNAKKLLEKHAALKEPSNEHKG